MVSAVESEDKFIVLAFCHKSKKSTDCNAWASAAIEGTGGKGVGKKDSAQFTISGISSVVSILEKAKLYFKCVA